MGKRRKSGLSRTQPDEYFTAGPLEFIRYGKSTMLRSRATEKQAADIQQRLTVMFPKIICDIDNLVSKLLEQIAGLPPGRLLQRAFWEFATIALTHGSHAVDDAGALRMLDYVQSLIASAPPSSCQVETVSEDAWQTLRTDVKLLFNKITSLYQPCLTATRQANDPSLDMELEEFRFRVEGVWMHVRGKRFQPHEGIALSELLTPHSDVLLRLFGISSLVIVEGFEEILRKLTAGPGLSMLALKQLQDDSISRMEAAFDANDIASVEEIMTMVFKDPELAARHQAIMGEIDGLDLFDVAKVTQFPASLIDALTWAPGEDTEFVASGKFIGWPLRVWPTMKRPFIRIDGRAMCFDLWGLFDNVYRALQRIVLKLEPEYRERWNIRQKEISEALPIKYFARLLPTNTSFAPVMYRWRAGSGKGEWCECDGLVIYDDHLFVIEVKAGAFTYTSPATDLASHLASLRNLIEVPAAQGTRFLDYLESSSEVPIYDVDRVEITRLRRNDFRHVTIVALSLDAFTELAARVQHLSKIGVDLGSRAVWVLSIDDLRVYADIFDNPLEFLHFVEQRMRAVTNDRIDLDDELDHLGLYLAQNNYGQFANEFGGKTQATIRFDGFRESIDHYYTAIVNNETPPLPRQNMPLRLRDIIDVLAASRKQRRSFLASFMLDAGNELRQAISDKIADQLKNNASLRHSQVFSCAGDQPFTVFTWSPAVPRLSSKALAYTRSVVASNSGASRLLIELEYDKTEKLVNIHWQQVTLDGLNPDELTQTRIMGETGKQRRIAQARLIGKIRVNAQCPCGSGKNTNVAASTKVHCKSSICITQLRLQNIV